MRGRLGLLILAAAMSAGCASAAVPDAEQPVAGEGQIVVQPMMVQRSSGPAIEQAAPSSAGIGPASRTISGTNRLAMPVAASPSASEQLRSQGTTSPPCPPRASSGIPCRR